MSKYEAHEYFLNRECTWLKFNERVLREAVVPSNPLLEQLNFIAIAASNLDEFFMIRVAGVKHLIESGIKHIDIAGLTPRQQFAAIQAMAHELVHTQYRYCRSILTRLRDKGLEFVKVQDLTAEQNRWLEDFFTREIYPVVTPMAVDSSHPFPFLASLNLNLAVLLRKRDGAVKTAILPVPSPVIRRIVKVPGTKNPKQYLFLEDILAAYAERFFLGCDILEAVPFRVTRDADLDIDEDVEDLLAEVEKSLKKRKKGAAVRLEISQSASRLIKEFLRKELQLEERDMYMIPGPLDCQVFFSFLSIESDETLRYVPFRPQPSFELAELGEPDLWKAVSARDIMVHHPYEKFETIEDFIHLAAMDPDVLAIKQTLYRVSSKSPIIAALATAAENGKQVTVLMEVKARFDEENNINMARKLEEAGCHVIYGIVGLKTHSKITLIVRREEDGIKRYVHLATGNYNGKTARIYTDIGILTANPLIGADASAFFNFLSGYSDPPEWNKLAVAPLNLRERIYEEIDQEIAWAKAGKKAVIQAKMNSLLDKSVIAKLYEASVAGVTIQLIIRGICVLRPGVKGISENIEVRSIVGRFLEHSRLFYFYNNGKEDVFISSADWMPRNLNERVELMVPIEYAPHKKRIKDILSLYLRDNTKAYHMEADGSYQYVSGKPADETVQAQEYLQHEAEQRRRRLHQEKEGPLYR
ncbi:polyphosphate kinase 1 [Megasphaera lornae]|jgi:polyphosphate kinase 1|uniref:Polyphosphate kinase n=1 Tax=Megasphaera lornae TaxID=1000568 RepID=D3LTY7_9FIRM|nr:polyphosphate kinase 1 [Megasphaera genomosp. type_1]EFD94358.1 polyphosphate kinase 1 [Megasphaera genomosp. type_1 str. 28L]KXB91236.1 polyphosphate kinase 1 [Veillonellaceae bacterium DNF00751]